MALNCPAGYEPSADGQSCVPVSSGAPSGNTAPGIPQGSTNYGTFTRNFFLTPGGTVTYTDTPNGKPDNQPSISNSTSSSTNQTIQDPAALQIQRDNLALEQKKQIAQDAKDKADIAHQAAVDALAQGNSAEAKRQFDISSAETQRYHAADIEARRADSTLAQTKFAFDSYTKLQDIAANPRNFLQSFFLSRGKDVPVGAQGGTATGSSTVPFTSFLPTFLNQMGLGTVPAGPSSAGGAGGGGGATTAAAPTLPNYSAGVTQQAAAAPGGALAEILRNQASGSKVGMMDKGGVISEPIVGIGTQSGNIYTLGEQAPNKPETVVPDGKSLADVRGMSGHDGAYDTGGELGYGVGTQGAAQSNTALMQLLNSLSGTSLSKSGNQIDQTNRINAPAAPPMLTTIKPPQPPQVQTVPPSPFNTFSGATVTPPAAVLPVGPGGVSPNLAPLYNGTATNTPLQGFQSQLGGQLPPFLARLFSQNSGDLSQGTNVPQRFALPPDVPLISSLAYSQMQPSEQQALLSYVSGYGVTPEDYIAAIGANTPHQTPRLPQFAFQAQG